MKVWRGPYPKFGAGIGLARVAKIADRLRVDLAAFGERSAVITGSNGKGSTAAMTAAILQQNGGEIGLFTSPHLFALNERFRIDGEDIGDEDLQRHWDRVVTATHEAGEHAALGGFEFLFLIAADWFAARACAFMVWEAGIGGRFDPTRLLEARRTALASLDHEHTELLGETLEEIARNKLDAAPDGARVFVGESCAAQREAIEAHCAERGVTPAFVVGLGGANLALASLPLHGVHQRANAVLAVALARHITVLSDDAIERGLAATRWPGRLEIIEVTPLVVIDVGHTPGAVRAALEGFAALAGGRPRVLVCGVSEDKPAQAIIGALAPGFSVIICAAARHKGRAAAEIAALAAAENPSAEVAVAENAAAARLLALAKAGADGAVYVAGSLFLAAEFKAAHLGRDPASLAFF